MDKCQLGGQKHLEKFHKNENKVYRDKGDQGWGAKIVYVSLLEFLVSAQGPLVLGLGLKGLGPGLTILPEQIRVGGSPPPPKKKSVSKMTQNGLKLILYRSLKS